MIKSQMRFLVKCFMLKVWVKFCAPSARKLGIVVIDVGHCTVDQIREEEVDEEEVSRINGLRMI